MSRAKYAVKRKTFSISSILILTGVLLGLLWIDLLNTPLQARDFDETWKRKTFPNSKYVEYQKLLNITVTHASGANMANYPISLEHEELFIFEKDDNKGFGIHMRGYGEYSVSKNQQGKPDSYTVAIGKFRYFDFNGDGVIDARYNGDQHAAYIIVNDAYVAVRANMKGFKGFIKTSLDGNTHYQFNDDKWIKINTK